MSQNLAAFVAKNPSNALSYLNTDATGNLKVNLASGSGTPAAVTTGALPTGAVAVTGASGNVANASAVATLAAVAAKNTWITGFEITAAGATAASVVTATVTGTIGGTLSYTFIAPAGVTAAATPLIVEFTEPVPSSAVNTAIVVTLPALGAGNTNATVVAHGFQA